MEKEFSLKKQYAKQRSDFSDRIMKKKVAG